MQLFYKILDEKTSHVQVYFGGRSDFAAENGFVPGDVEQCITSGKWYLKGKMPIEEKAADMRLKRDEILSSYDWRIERYKEQKSIGVETTDPDDVFLSLLEYRQYLRDLPDNPSFPYIEIKEFSK